MWRNPNYDAPPPAQPPEERGERLATIPRNASEEIHVSLDEWNGHPFVSIRVWAVGSDNQFWPVKGKGVSVRIRELSEVASALMRARDLIIGPPQRRPQSIDRRPQPGRAALPGPAPARKSSLPFDEFEGQDR